MKELVEQLMQATRIDERQARGGAAVLLKAARDKLGPQQFTSLLGGLPGIEDLLGHAPQAGGLGKLLGGLAGSVGGGRGALIATVVSGFGSLGLTPEHAKQMAPVMLQYLRSKVGPESAAELEKTLRAGL